MSSFGRKLLLGFPSGFAMLSCSNLKNFVVISRGGGGGEGEGGSKQTNVKVESVFMYLWYF